MSALLKDRPDLKAAQETYVYFARAFPSGLIKIGYSARPYQRMSGVMREAGERVSVLFTLPGTRVQENGFHKRFRGCQFKGRGREWFYETDMLHDYLKERGHAGTRIVIEKHVVLEPAPTRFIEVLKPVYIERAQQATEPKPCLVGYARVSTEDQNLDVQLTALRFAGVEEEHTFVEKISALTAHRPQFHLMMKFVEQGDTLIVHSLSRIGRDIKQIHKILDQLAADGVPWRSLTEPHLDTTTAAGRLMLNVTGAVMEKMPEPTNYASAAQAKADDLARIEAEKKSYKHVGVAFGFYPFDWNIKPTWGPVVYTLNLGPFALSFIY